jgi:chemotaxis protein methyltransferase CheR
VHPEQIQWASFYRNLKTASGLDLNAYKQDQLQRRILSMIESKGLDTLESFWGYLKQGEDHMKWFLDKLAINVSELFRNTEKWTELREKIIPSLLSQSPRLKIWSAGCSFGAEAHSVAILLDKYFAGSHTIVGTDIDHTALDQAKAGTFNDADMRGVPADLRSTYFTHNDGVWTASPKLKRYLNFKYGNLISDTFDTGFDMILCRNVVIYFTEETKNSLYDKFFRSLKPGGYLFVGSTERIFNSRDIGFETPLPFFYRKPTQGEHVWRNAS